MTSEKALFRVVSALPPWQLSAICIAVTETIVAAMSLAFHGYIAPDYLVTGFVASLFVSYSVLKILSLSRMQLEERGASEARMREALDSLFAFVGIFSLDGTALYYNRIATEATGVPLGEVLGIPFWDAYWWSYSPEVQAAVRRTLEQAAKGEPAHFSLDARIRPAGMINTEGTFAPIRDENGAITRIIGFGVNVTERKQAEEALRQSEERLRQVAQVSGIGIFDHDHRTGTVYWSPELRNIFGWDVHEQGTLEKYFACVYLEDRERVAATIRHAHDPKLGTAIDVENRIIRRDGEVRWITTRAQTFFEGESDAQYPVRTVGAVLDVTERKRAEAISTRLGRIVEDSVNEIYVFDSNTLRFLQVNRGARENLGYSEQELLCLTPVDIKPQFTRESFEELIRPLRENRRQQIIFQTVHRRKDGSRYNVEVRLQLSRTETPPVFIAIIQDITERMSTEEQLRQTQKMEAVGQLTGGVAHDFNNLLAIIGGNLELLEEKLVDNPGPHDLAEKARRAVERGATLTRSLLAFSRQQPLSPRVVDLKKLVQEMADLIRRTVPETIDIEIVAGTGLWKCEVDPGQLQNALLNLIANARDAMPEGGKLTIETANARLDDDYAAAQADVAPGQYVMLAVSDTGQGMPPEVMARAFDPFFTTKGPGNGVGLGLSMVYGFAKQSNGYAKIYSEVGQGSTVRLYLPRSMAAVEVEAPTMPVGDVRSKGETVLVVEDDPDVRSLTCGLIRSVGYEVFEAGDPQGALQAVRNTPRIALLLIDVVLPGGMNGPKLAEEIRRLQPQIKVLYMSGYTENAILHHGRLDPGVHLLQKPFTKRDLVSKIRRLLEGKNS